VESFDLAFEDKISNGNFFHHKGTKTPRNAFEGKAI
jgi:hypothetical protein